MHGSDNAIFKQLLLSEGKCGQIAGSTQLASATCFVALKELLLGQKCSKQDFAKSDVKLLTIDRGTFNQLVQQHPEIGLSLYKDVSQALDSASQVC